jgi:hypothetical protein
MTAEELARAGLKLCDEIESAVIAGNLDLAFEFSLKLKPLTVELAAKGLAEGGLDTSQAYSRLMEPLGRALLISGNVEAIKWGLQLLRMMLASEISDELAESYMTAAPKIGSA